MFMLASALSLGTLHAQTPQPIRSLPLPPQSTAPAAATPPAPAPVSTPAPAPVTPAPAPEPVTSTPPSASAPPADSATSSSVSTPPASPDLGTPPLTASTNAVNAKGKSAKEADGKVHPRPVHLFSTAAIAAKITFDGFGADVATPLNQVLNFRVGGSFFSYSGSFNSDGIAIKGDLKFRSAIATFDYFPFHGGFHISPGVEVYNGNNLNATANVPPGQQFDLGDTTYLSSTTNPVNGTASLTFGNRTAPRLTVGWGNMVPRSKKHFTVPFEVGFEYIGQPLLALHLLGYGCLNNNAASCVNLATDPTALANIQQEQNDANDTLKYLKFYPVISLGFSYKF
jgi:hypothetical protein